jgi:opacity protein-like surface antigen
MKTILRLTAIAFVIAAPAAIHAQGFIGIHGLASMPLTEMKQARYGNGGGLGIEFLSNPLNARNGVTPKVQFHVGLGGYYLLAGMKRYELMLDSPQTGKADVRASNNVFALQVIGRASTMVNKYIGAYGDVFGGARFLNTTQVISPQTKSSDYEDETSSPMQNSIPATYGLGAGLLFRLTDHIFLDLGTAYTWGTRAKYIAMKDVYQEGNEIRYPTHKTTTDKLLFRAGVSFRLNFADSDDCDCDCGDSKSSGSGYYYDKKTENTPAPKSEPRKQNLLKKNKTDY